MTCWIGEALDGPKMKSHTSMLRMFFVYTLALCMPIFLEKISPETSGKKLQTFHCSNVTIHTIYTRFLRNILNNYDYIIMSIMTLKFKFLRKNIFIYLFANLDFLRNLLS